ncbi:MAG: hypothetical protein IKL92_00070, partial [Oscillospiraceae bacterium]|nr:hypothetical protein [Oscillospiraceae bacterium]
MEGYEHQLHQYLPHSDSIIIKKEDALTGNPIGGAEFELWQKDSVLTFTYDAGSDTYVYDENGTITRLAGSESGYYEVNIQGFSYDYGDIEVCEVVAPEGYTPIENIRLGYATRTAAVMSARPPIVESTPPPTDGEIADIPNEGEGDPTETPADGNGEDDEPNETPAEEGDAEPEETPLEGEGEPAEVLPAEEGEGASTETPADGGDEDDEPKELPPANEEETEEEIVSANAVETEAIVRVLSAFTGDNEPANPPTEGDGEGDEPADTPT